LRLTQQRPAGRRLARGQPPSRGAASRLSGVRSTAACPLLPVCCGRSAAAGLMKLALRTWTQVPSREAGLLHPPAPPQTLTRTRWSGPPGPELECWPAWAGRREAGPHHRQRTRLVDAAVL